jgi:hypothetical protein
MTAPRWVDEHGKPMATRPCHRCGTLTPVGRTFRLEHLSMIGWQLFTEAGIVQWCGHDHHFLVVPHADGERAVLVPIFGEAV